MDAQFLDRWIAALESGDYKHGQTALRRDEADGEHFCCMGVACELLKVPRLRTDPLQEGGRVVQAGRYGTVEDAHNGYFPASAQALLGLDEYGTLPDGRTLAGINDRSNSFAPVIEALKANREALIAVDRR